MKNNGISFSRTKARALWLSFALPALAGLLVVGLSAGAVAAQPVDATFTYQGELKTSAGRADGDFDFEFNLYDSSDPVTGVLLSSMTILDAAVSGGLFTVELNFGSDVFTGEPRWLEIGVRPAGPGPMTYLYPLQRVSPAPYSLGAASVDWNGITNVPPNIADGVTEIPAGVIAMWSGSLASIPSGWALCDGTNGTPDLRDRFILGAAALENPGAVGGSDLHSHAVNAHKHWFQRSNISTTSNGSHSHSMTASPNETVDAHDLGSSATVARSSHTHSISPNGSHIHSVSVTGWSDDQTGGTDTVGHLPPYFKLAFIMKLP